MAFAHRPQVMSDRGIVVSGHHRASEAGASMLRQGGNAMDAAIATAATLAAAIPHMNGLGGDAMALYYDANADKVTAINGSGRAPAAATVAHYRGLGHEAIPRRGPSSMSVPGVVRAWGDCLRRWGTRSLAIATPGDHGQPQTIYQVLRHVFVDSIPIQDAIERPRLRHDQEKVVMVEDRAPAGWTDDLQAAGYSICDVGSWSRLMGGVNAVHRLSENVWSAGADPRRSSYAVTGGS